MTLLNSYLSTSKVKRVLSLKPGQEGFSLIELVVVVAVLAVLSAIAIPQFANITMRARAAAATSTVATMAKECAVKLALDPSTATIKVPDLNGYKGNGSDGKGFHEIAVANGVTNSSAGSYLEPGDDYTCSNSKIFGFVTDTAAEYPSFYYNQSTGEKRCTAQASSNALLASRLCPSGTNW